MSSTPNSRKTATPHIVHDQTADGSPINKLDYHPGGRPLLSADDPTNNHHQRNSSSTTSAGRASQEHSYAGSFFEDIAEGIVDQDRRKFHRESLRYLSFLWAIINCLGAGSLTAYSLYAPLFQRKLHYTQLQVNGVSITAELAMYLPVPLFGFLCDRFGPGLPSLLAGVMFGGGYILAAFTYQSGALGDGGWPYWVMILAFIPIGCATSCMYLSAVTTCAKNFGRGKYKGLALALPIACFGLSGMWESQVGSQLLYERRPDGDKGDVDVFRYFVFLGLLLLTSGVVGFFALRIVGEEELIDEAVEELEQSGLLEDSDFFQRSDTANYGTVDGGEAEALLPQHDEDKARFEDEQRKKKTWLLNSETRRFLSDHTMWWLAAGFFLVTGPGEAFINNLGTIIGTLSPPPTSTSTSHPTTSAATHVSIVAATSTIARILTGTLTDLFAPTTPQHQHRRGPNSLSASLSSLPPQPKEESQRWELPRPLFLLTFTLLMSLGQVLLASGALQSRADLFWLVSASIGAGYGAVFSLVPILISVVWGVENFGTNWGIVATVPAVGATVWGLIYSGVYQAAAGWPGADGDGRRDGLVEEVLCYGVDCYAPTFWAMAGCVWVACGMWLWAWRGRDGWMRRGVAV